LRRINVSNGGVSSIDTQLSRWRRLDGLLHGLVAHFLFSVSDSMSSSALELWPQHLSTRNTLELALLRVGENLSKVSALRPTIMLVHLHEVKIFGIGQLCTASLCPFSTPKHASPNLVRRSKRCAHCSVPSLAPIAIITLSSKGKLIHSPCQRGL